MFFGRMDAEEERLRIKWRQMEWVQHPMGKESFGSDMGILFHMLTNIYVYPSGFNFDVTGQDPVFETDKTYTTFDAEQEAKNLDDFLTDLAEDYPDIRTGHMFVLFGMDFQYTDAFDNYRSMDNMIKYMNENYSKKWHL